MSEPLWEAKRDASATAYLHTRHAHGGRLLEEAVSRSDASPFESEPKSGQWDTCQPLFTYEVAAALEAARKESRK